MVALAIEKHKQVILAIGQHSQNKRRTDFTLDLILPAAKLFLSFLMTLF